MARPVLQTLLFVAALTSPATADGSDDGAIERRIREMRQRLSQDEGVLRAVEADRRLAAKASASIYGDVPGTRKYTSGESQRGAMDHMWLLLCGALAMFTQAGFAMLEAGCCRVRNVQSTMLKNLTALAVGTLGWWIFGWSFAYSGPHKADGTLENYFAGYEEFAGHTFLSERDDHQMEPTTKIAKWFFRWAFCATAATIVGMGVLERVSLLGYSWLAFLVTSFVYPIIVAWTWGKGWLYDMNSPGYMDFAGSGVVHLTGGAGALVGAIIAGPRSGRFEGMSAKQRLTDFPEPQLETEKFMPHSQPLIALGTFVLWFAWYGFTCGSTLAMSRVETAFLAAQVAMNTTIAAAAGGLTTFALRSALGRRYHLQGMCAGVLGGLVSITAGCASVECGSACLIGVCGGIICQLASSALRIAKIDDPVDAFAVHGACGMWGVFAAAAFDWGYGFEHFHGFNGFRSQPYPDDGTNKQGGNVFAANFAEIFGVIGWSGVLCGIAFGILRAAGLLRDPDDTRLMRYSYIGGYDRGDKPPLKSI